MNEIKDVLTKKEPEYQLVDLSRFKCQEDCTDCNGYFRVDLPVDHPQFGQLFPCSTMQRKRVLENGGGGLLADEVRNLNWNLVQEGISDGHKGRDIAREVCKQGYGLVLLYGNYGQAKTLMLKIGVAAALRAGKTAHYANMSEILDDIRMAFDEKNGQQTALIRRIERWSALDLLAIDELDKANSTEWARERMHQLLNTRYTAALREQAVTLIAANLNEERGVDDLDGYLASRLRDSRVGHLVELNGPDGRLSMPKGYRY